MEITYCREDSQLAKAAPSLFVKFYSCYHAVFHPHPAFLETHCTIPTLCSFFILRKHIYTVATNLNSFLLSVLMESSSHQQLGKNATHIALVGMGHVAITIINKISAVHI